jgi:hypothetical protein
VDHHHHHDKDGRYRKLRRCSSSKSFVVACIWLLVHRRIQRKWEDGVRGGGWDPIAERSAAPCLSNIVRCVHRSNTGNGKDSPIGSDRSVLIMWIVRTPIVKKATNNPKEM